ncbi:MAG: hypothetical protein Aurels2KO_41980 [Aureliella sp.]
MPDTSLSAISEHGQLTFRSAGNAAPTEISTEELVSWGAWQPAYTTPTVWTAGGSWIAGELSFSGQHTTVQPAWSTSVDIPLTQVGGFLLRAPANPNQRRELIGEMLTSKGSRDLVWLASGQKLSGLLKIESSTQGIQFVLSNGNQSVSMAAEEIRAVVFSPELVAPPKPADLPSVIGLSDGSMICVSELAEALASLSSRQPRSLNTSGGFRFAIARDQVGTMPRINLIAASSADCLRLSQMVPASYKYSSDTLTDWPLGKNTDVHQKLLSAGRGIQPRGLAMHATSQAAFRIDEDCERFITEVTLSGVPPASSSSRSSLPKQSELGSVTCEVLVARNGKLEQLANVELSSAANRRAQINVVCRGSRLLVLVVREADKGNYGDEVYWNEARLIR